MAIFSLLLLGTAVLGVTLDQSPKVLVRGEGKTIFLPCNVTGLGSSDYIHWYQVKDGQAPSRLLYISQGGTTAEALLHKLHLFAQEQMTVGDRKVFGSGTRLYVTGEPVKLPKVSGYLPSKKYIDKQGKQTMLCQASDMFPDLVKFTWRTKSEAGDFKDVPEENVVEQSYKRDNKTVTVTSMMIIDKNTIEKNNYQCTVTHEGTTKNTEILEMKRGNLKKL
uniref:Ig-like domain-containing protein n=1 Tax=Cyprinus carpio TaxID=7962 RepID=A0A8C2DUX8_CYPCA